MGVPRIYKVFSRSFVSEEALAVAGLDYRPFVREMQSSTDGSNYKSSGWPPAPGLGYCDPSFELVLQRPAKKTGAYAAVSSLAKLLPFSHSILSTLPLV